MGAEAPAQIRVRRMREVVLGEIAAGENPLDQRKPGGRPIAHGDGHGAIELDDR